MLTERVRMAVFRYSLEEPASPPIHVGDHRPELLVRINLPINLHLLETGSKFNEAGDYIIFKLLFCGR